MTTTATEYLDVKGVADRLGVDPSTVHTYRSRGGFPEPDNRFGQSPVWLPETIDAWKAARPGQGKGGGRKPKASDADG